MKPRRFFQFLLLALLCLSLLACGQTEKKAQGLYDQAAQLEQSGDRPGAVAQYQLLLTTYPKSQVAPQAQAALTRLQQILENERQAALARTVKEASYQAVDSIVKVIDGYQAMFNRLPRKAKDFDNPAFFFDSAYMAGTVPAGYTVYLAPGSGGAYRIWSLKGEGDAGYVLDGKTGVFSEITRAQALEEIAANYAEEKRSGGLVFLQPQARGGQAAKK